MDRARDRARACILRDRREMEHLRAFAAYVTRKTDSVTFNEAGKLKFSDTSIDNEAKTKIDALGYAAAE